MAKTPPSRSYRLFSGAACLTCACALSAPPIQSRCGGQRQPCDHASSCDRSRNSLCHDYLLGDEAIVLRACRPLRTLFIVQKRPTRDPAATELTAHERRYSLHHLIQIHWKADESRQVRTMSAVTAFLPATKSGQYYTDARKARALSFSRCAFRGFPTPAASVLNLKRSVSPRWF